MHFEFKNDKPYNILMEIESNDEINLNGGFIIK